MAKFKPVRNLMIGLLLLVTAGVVVAIMWCPTASERANAITLEDIQTQAKDFEKSKKLSKVGKDLAATQFGSEEREAKLNELISLFDQQTQAFIKALPREERIEAITMKLKEENNAKEGKLAKLQTQEKLCWWR